MTSRQVARTLYAIETHLQLQGENDFKSRAYARAARALETSGLASVELDNEREWSTIPGIGKALASEIREIIETGTSSQLESLKAVTPPGLLEILEIPKLGAKKVRALHMQLGIATLGELEYAARENRIATLPGFGQKSQENILAGLLEVKRVRGMFRIDVAEREGKHLIELLRGLPSVRRADPGGRLRRGAEEYEHLDIVVASDDPAAVERELAATGHLDELEREDRTISGVIDQCWLARVHVARPEVYPVALHQWSGASDYRFMVSIPLADRGYELREDGLYKNDELVPVGSEEELFDLAGMQYIEPELREGIDEVRQALDRTIPELITPADMKGALHVHSVWSDGRSKIVDIAEHVRSLGYRYLLMCDHSKAAFYANGLDEGRLAEQGREIDELNRRWDPAEFRVLKGIECDVLPDGRMDLSDDALASLDAVVASIHSSFGLPEEAQTERLLAALEHPSVTIIGHPTGRLILGRKGYPVDLKRVIDRAAELGKSIELNANPHRLDLSWRMVRHATRKGVKVAINPDAHSLEDFDNVRHGVKLGRKGWLTRGDLLNAMDAEAFLAFARPGRKAEPALPAEMA